MLAVVTLAVPTSAASLEKDTDGLGVFPVDCLAGYAGWQIRDTGYFIGDPMNRFGYYQQVLVFNNFILVFCALYEVNCAQVYASDLLMDFGSNLSNGAYFAAVASTIPNSLDYASCATGVPMPTPTVNIAQ